MKHIITSIIFCLCVIAAKAQCEYSKDKRHPERQYVRTQVGSTFGAYSFDLGKGAGKYFVRLHIEPGFVTVTEPYKKKAPMTTEDSLVLRFETGEPVVLRPTEEVLPVLEADGPGKSVAIWRYHIRIEVEQQLMERLRREKLSNIAVRISGKWDDKDVKNRQHDKIMDAAKCALALY